VPAELAKSVQAVKDAGWWRVGLAEEIGGVPAPAPVTWAINEMLHCANPSAGFFYSLGPALANALYLEGPEQQKRWADRDF
jgi:alkylation response protein AidB-like acyl-CoA dehydrogenase